MSVMIGGESKMQAFEPPDSSPVVHPIHRCDGAKKMIASVLLDDDKQFHDYGASILELCSIPSLQVLLKQQESLIS